MTSAMLTRIPGVGRKTAERLLVEMRDYFKALPVAKGGLCRAPRRASEALHALVALGYKPPEAQRMLDAVASGGQHRRSDPGGAAGRAPKQGRT